MKALSIGWRLLTSRLGLAGVLCLALWVWHLSDKRQALEVAREGYVKEFELTAVRAELDALNRRMATAKQANQSLQEKVQVAEGEAIRFADDLEAFKRETKINPDGVVDSDLLRQLRAN